MPLTIDNEGRWHVPALLDGRPKALETGFLDSVRPAWLTLASGGGAPTETFNTSLEYTLTTAAAINAYAQLAGPGVVSTGMRACHVELSGVKFSSSTASVDIGVAGSASAGIVVRHTAGTTNAVGISGGATLQLDKVQITGQQAATYRNLGVIVLPATREVYVLEGDELLDYRKFDAMTGGTLTPFVKITATTAAAVTMTLGRVRVAYY